MADTAADVVRRIAIKLAALAQDGLTFAAGDYDLDRYRQVSQLATELLATIGGRPAAELTLELGRDSGYATPKVDVRGAVFDERERVLLMREKTDGRWSLPGGWADPGDAPSTAVNGHRSGSVDPPRHVTQHIAGPGDGELPVLRPRAPDRPCSSPCSPFSCLPAVCSPVFPPSPLTSPRVTLLSG